MGGVLGSVCEYERVTYCEWVLAEVDGLCAIETVFVACGGDQSS